MTAVSVLETPLGPLEITGNGGAVVSARLTEAPLPPRPDAVTALAEAEYRAWFAGTRRSFTFPMAPAGTGFQQAVWAALRTVPYGATVTYGALAALAGRPGAARAVGAAVGRNPILIAIPCHRVVAAGGLGGFSALGGTETKRALLALEAGGPYKPEPLRVY